MPSNVLPCSARPGFQPPLRGKRRGHLEVAVRREFQAAFQHAGGFHQRAVISLVGDLGQGAVVVQAVDDQQHHDARQQQDDKQRADADAWHPGYPQAHSGFRCGGLAGDAFQHVAQPAHDGAARPRWRRGWLRCRA
ncbi:hypothetical protein G6F24_015784 [Rhizopus arrhizus]|nr:hypothetical protein G6F24_015784 [Rhizopus arrhizus]